MVHEVIESATTAARQPRKGFGRLGSAIRALLVTAANLHGIDAVAAEIGVSPSTVIRGMADADMRRASQRLIEIWAEQKRSDQAA